MAAPSEDVKHEAPGGSAVPRGVLDQARANLDEQRQTLRQRIAEFPGDVDDLQEATATLGQGETELATRQVGVELRVALDTASQDLLDDVERALQRIDDGTYGVCTSCGGSIGLERLRALPQGELCIRCQTRDEQAHKPR